MGLDCSHGAFSGAYGSFNRLRQEVCRAMGGSYPPHKNTDLDFLSWYWGDGYREDTHPGLGIFLSHSDCDGEISAKDCLLVARDLEVIAEKMPDYGGGGHLERDGGYRAVARKFAEGCRLAHGANESLEFE